MGCLQGDTLPGLGDAQRSRSPSCAAQGRSYSKSRCFFGGTPLPGLALPGDTLLWDSLGAPCSRARHLGGLRQHPAPPHPTQESLISTCDGPEQQPVLWDLGH